MTTQQITLDKFGSETSLIKERYSADGDECFVLVCLPQPGRNRITDLCIVAS
jgi:hypothetical protein